MNDSFKAKLFDHAAREQPVDIVRCIAEEVAKHNFRVTEECRRATPDRCSFVVNVKDGSCNSHTGRGNFCRLVGFPKPSEVWVVENVPTILDKGSNQVSGFCEREQRMSLKLTGSGTEVFW